MKEYLNKHMFGTNNVKYTVGYQHAICLEIKILSSHLLYILHKYPKLFLGFSDIETQAARILKPTLRLIQYLVYSLR